jgi:transposase-like protein
LRKRQPQRGDKWHLDEVCLKMKGKSYWLWRTIDQDGYELDVLVQPHRSAKAALRFFKKLLKGFQYVPRVMITDKLKSYKAAKRKLLKSTEHRSHKRLNNRIEVSHQPTRLREKQMRRFKSPPQAQLFLSIFDIFRNYTYQSFHHLPMLWFMVKKPQNSTIRLFDTLKIKEQFMHFIRSMVMVSGLWLKFRSHVLNAASAIPQKLKRLTRKNGKVSSLLTSLTNRIHLVNAFLSK